MYVTDAIVLSRFDFGEADRILTLITPEIGKLKAIAKGIRRPTSRVGGSLEPFAELRIQLARGRTFDVVTQVVVGHAWLRLRDSLESAATAWYMAELADRSLEERHPAEPLYALLHRAYELLDAEMAPGRVARWYEMRLADDMHQRKRWMIEDVDAVVALPGGSGTFEELLEAITWKRLGLYVNPIVIVNVRGFYDPLPIGIVLARVCQTPRHPRARDSRRLIQPT